MSRDPALSSAGGPAPPAADPAPAAAATAEAPPAAILRQMIAVLETERQALAALDAEALTEAARVKEGLCGALAPLAVEALDPETRGLAETARRLNEINRRVRNLLAANVASRLAALAGVGDGVQGGATGPVTYGPGAPAPIRPQTPR
ncbi:hypothetical protein [Erythrobacter sp.]|uniref:hypothetical protein n=1 Tax=Erythrobacter sp. TaxID=1042 RepID=UPI0025BEE51D|nr:hypothetical protein [Erythrobacter sp.]